MYEKEEFLYVALHQYLELQCVPGTERQVSSHCHPVTVRPAEHYGRGGGSAETPVSILIHSFISQHQPNTHLVERMIESRFLIEVLQGRREAHESELSHILMNTAVESTCVYLT